MQNVILYFFILILVKHSLQNDVVITGPGLNPDRIVMPARYFFINFTHLNENTHSSELGQNLVVEIDGKTNRNKQCRIWTNKLDRKDGTFIVRYKLYETCYDLTIHVHYKRKDVGGSPFKNNGPVHPDQCNCPEKNINRWMKSYGCPESIPSITDNLLYFKNVNTKMAIQKIIQRFHQPESTSFCHYVVKNNEIFRKCFGKHVGFNMFSDNILLSLARKVILPNMELAINLGDWPLVHKNSEPLPIFSWCGSDDTLDITIPTYDITESTLENMGRVTLDMLSVQAGADLKWEDREPRAIWRGRDSRLERLKLIDIARANPDLFNASLTNFFFFRDKEAEYGPKLPHITFFKFFDYKYQVNIDGTVAAYRLPYLLGGGGMVLKQDSPYHEHFYDLLRPWEHFVPVRRDLSDLVERVKWARDHDVEAHTIATNAKLFANENLLPQHIICYHAVLFNEWSKRIENDVVVEEGMTRVPQPTFDCDCSDNNNRDEL